MLLLPFNLLSIVSLLLATSTAVAGTVVGDPATMSLRKSASREKLEKAKSIVENVKSLLANAKSSSSTTNVIQEAVEPTTQSALPIWAYWAIFGGVVLLSLIAYVVYRYKTWVPKKKAVKVPGTAGTASSDTENSRLLVTSDSH